MNRIDTRTVELTEGEQVIKEWFDALLDDGLSIADALERIELVIPRHGTTWLLLRNDHFRDWLIG